MSSPNSANDPRVILKMHVSIDGFAATDDGGVDWVFPQMDSELEQWEIDHLWQAGAHLMGRSLYEEMAAHWPTSTERFAAPMNEIPKVVFSKTLRETPWAETRICSGDPAGAIAELKSELEGDLLVHGGTSFARSLSRLDLIDVYRLIVHPVVLGSGIPCFAGRQSLSRSNTQTFPSGAVAITYETVRR